MSLRHATRARNATARPTRLQPTEIILSQGNVSEPKRTIFSRSEADDLTKYVEWNDRERALFDLRDNTAALEAERQARTPCKPGRCVGGAPTDTGTGFCICIRCGRYYDPRLLPSSPLATAFWITLIIIAIAGALVFT